jgi:hypothetical protein
MWIVVISVALVVCKGHVIELSWKRGASNICSSFTHRGSC